MSQQIRGWGSHLGFPINLKNTNLDKGTRDKAKIHVNFKKPTFLCRLRQDRTYDKK